MTHSPSEFVGQLLHQACLYDNSELLSDLLMNDEQKGNINALDVVGRSVIYTAVSNRSIGCLRILLTAGGK